jgi:enoyl-CoA hydratase/carnithine racemase
MELDEVSYEKVDGVAEVALNRPRNGTRSRLAPAARDQLLWHRRRRGRPRRGACCCAARARRSRRAVTSPATFATAAEQQRFLERSEQFHGRCGLAPIVAAVHGSASAPRPAVASCDIVIAADNARFGVPEGRIGLVGGSPLVALVGKQWAKFLILTGEMLDGAGTRTDSC